MSTSEGGGHHLQNILSLLLAEDDDSLRETLTLFFSSQGFKVHAAQTGREAVDIALARKISFSVMDINMPCLGGIEALERINEKIGRFPCIFMSGDASPEVMNRALDAGGFTFVKKPIQMDLMRESVNRLIIRYFNEMKF